LLTIFQPGVDGKEREGETEREREREGGIVPWGQFTFKCKK